MQPTQRKYFLWILGSSLLGLLDSIQLLLIHTSSSAMGPGCNISETISCEALQYKAYSECLGIPIPIFSILFYMFTTGLALRELFRPRDQLVSSILLLWPLAWLSVVASIYFAVISLVVLKMLCPYCAVLYVVSGVFWWASWQLRRTVLEPGIAPVWREVKKVMKSPRYWGLGLLCLAVIFGVHLVQKRRGGLSDSASSIDPEELRTLGSIQAPVTIAEFSDFQCPYCSVAAMILKELEREMRGKVKVVYKFYPLDRSCNSLGGGHKDACAAARAAYCAGLQKKFFPYHDLLFTSQKSLPESTLQEFAKQVGLDLSSFRVCMKSEEAAKAVEKDLSEGKSLGVNGTPSIFINGRRYQGKFTVSALKETIQALQP